MGRIIDWYYVYTYSAVQETYYFDGTHGTEKSAIDRVADLGKRGIIALYLINHVIKSAFY